MEELKLALLGGAQVTLGGKPLTGFVSNKCQALLFYLAVTGRPHLRPSLAALLWGDLPDEDASSNLRKSLTNLRHLLDPYLLITRHTVEFNLNSPYWLDVTAFEKGVSEVQGTQGTKGTALNSPNSPNSFNSLHEVVELYHGEFLAGFNVRDALPFEEWVVVERERLREQALSALDALALRSVDSGNYGEAIHYTTRLLALDPWREEAHRRLMLLLARTGQRPAALAQYETCRRLLAAELGVEPSPETAALYERIRAAVASPTLSLPAEPTPLVGRLAEVTLLSRQLRTADCRLLTVTGPGGVGKSRLTLAVAERLAGTGDFLHQVAYVPLAGVASPAFLAPAIAEACQFAFSGREDLQAQLLNYLSQKEMLLVLDSFDHLLSTPDDSPATPIQNPLVFLADLLRRAPAVKLLVTSRERLNLNGEWVFPLNGLTQTEGLGLFQQSAARARPGFIFTESNQAAVERICHLVDGLPLGIELAASWVRVLSCAEIAAEIEGSLDFLASNARDGPERQRSLRVVLDTSWQMLTPAEQAAFTQLFLFRGTFQREAAAKVAGATLSILSGLVDKSIIHRHPNGRYELHELLRRYAEEQMGQGGERAALQSRHAAYFAAWAQQMETQLQGGEGQRAALDDLAAEIENVRAGWQWAVQRGRLAELEQYERPLYEFYHTRSWLQEGCETFSEAVAAVEPLAETADKQRLLSKLLGRQAAFYDHLGHYEQAKEILRRALVMAQEVEARPVISFLQLKLGRVAHNLGDMATAKTHLEAALAVSRSLNDAVAMANNLEGLAIIALNLGDFDQARRLRESSLELYQQAGDQRGMMVALNNMGAIAYSCAEYAEAKRRFSESAALSRVLSDRRSLAIALHNLSEVSYRLGQYEEALRLGYESLALFEEIGYPLGVIHGRLNLGNIYTALGEAEAALGEYRPALGSALALSAMSLAVEVLLGFARLFIQRGQKELALERLAFAIHHPALPQSERLEAEQLFAEVAAGLPEGIVAAAEARGRALSLEELAA